ncbi:MAG: adenylosuccinate synthase, partial [Planctomycetes bacterium]|nr:adenylosuccinate synthase [Planctomycetota bacterium]
GVALDPAALLEEIDGLAQRGRSIDGRLKISSRAHVVMPYHKIEDRISESEAASGQRIGTTARGIGPCYADKVRRHHAIRMADLLDATFLDERLPQIVATRRETLRRLSGQALADPGAPGPVAPVGSDPDLDVEAIVKDARAWSERLGPMVCDTTVLLENALNAGRRLLFEGANGCLLDIDHGTYPFVTSSTTTAAGIPTGAGVPPRTVTRVIGVCKAYATRVGEGPFVTELTDATGDWIREQGHEYGTTTGRPRRCGWFDAVATRYSARLSGTTEIALMHLDTLSGADAVGICTAYEIDGTRIDRMPCDARTLERARPVFEMHPGWSESLRAVKNLGDLPANARRYLDRLQELVGVPIRLVSVGPERTQTLRLDQ